MSLLKHGLQGVSGYSDHLAIRMLNNELLRVNDFRTKQQTRYHLALQSGIDNLREIQK